MACCRRGGGLTNEDVLGGGPSLVKSLYGRRSSLSSSASSKSGTSSSSLSSSSSSGVRRVGGSSRRTKKSKKQKCKKPKKHGSDQARKLQITSAVQPFSHDNRMINKLNKLGYTRQYTAGGITPGQSGSKNCAGDVSGNPAGDGGQAITLYNNKTGDSATYNFGTGQLALSAPPEKRKKKKNVLYVRQYDKKNKCKPKKQPCQTKRCPPARHPPLCESYPPKRNDCYPSAPKAYDLAYNTYFEEGFDVGTSHTNDWNWFYTGSPDSPSFIADNADIDTTNGLLLDSSVYTKTYPQTTDGPDPDGFLDHFKAVATLNSTFCVKEEGELYLEAYMSAGVNPATSALQSSQLNYFQYMYNPGSDPRIAYSTLSLFDKEHQFALHHVFTNGTLYAAMERMPFTRGAGSTSNTPQSFMSIKPLYRRAASTPLDNYMRVGLAFDRKIGAKWYVNGSLVHTEAVLTEPAERSDILGDYGGVYTDAAPLINNLQVMIGHWSYMDGMNAHQASTIAQTQQRGFVPQTEPPRALTNLRAYTTAVNRTFSNSTYYEVASETTFAPKMVNYVQGAVDDNTGAITSVPPSARVFGQGAAMRILNLKVQYRC